MKCFLLVATMALTLAGCGTVPLGSIPQLARIDARSTDLEVLRVAVDLPNGVRPRPGGVRLDAVLKIDGSTDEQQRFRLIESAADAQLPQPGEGRLVVAYRFPPEEAARFGTLRARMADAQAARRKGSLGLGIAADEFCAAGPLADGPLLVTTYVRTSETGRYVVASRNFDLQSDASISSAMAALPPCGPAAEIVPRGPA